MKSRLNENVANLKKFFLKLSAGRRAALSAGLFAVIAMILIWTNQTDRFDQVFYDIAQRNLSRYLAPSQEIAIVAIDTETLEESGKRWPWPRDRFASLIDRISSYSPRAILLDIVFQHPEEISNGEGDRALEEAIKKAGHVALISYVEEDITSSGRQKRHYRSMKQFRDVAFCEGYIHSFIDADATIRRFSLHDAKMAEEGCLLKLARKAAATKMRMSDFENMPETSQIIFARKLGGIRLFSAQDLLENKINAESLKDKVVVLGATAQALHDYHKTSLGLMSGPEILAAAYDTLISKRTAEPSSGATIRILLMMAGFLTSFLLAARRYYRHEILSLSIYTAAVFVFYHLAAALLLFAPLSCLFITWACVSLSNYLMNRFVEVVEQQIAQAESDCAGKIQAELFPHRSISTTSHTVRGMCIPCDTTGGDFYDYFELADGNIIFMLGDVAGHGFSAAILTVMAKTTIQLLRNKSMVTPDTVIENLNLIIFELVKKKKFMTMAVGHLNVESHEVNIVLAGHLPPLHISREGAVKEMAKAGFPLGVIKNLPLNRLSCTLQAGDSLLLYTDGIVEALNWQNEQYGYKAWYAFLSEQTPHLGDNTPIDTLLSGVNQHKRGRSFDDDVTCLLITRRN